MSAIEVAALRAYSRSAAHQRALDGARRILSDGLSKATALYLACSFGKDSAAMLDLALAVQPGIDVRFVRWKRETEYLDDYDRVIAEWRARAPELCLFVLELSRESTHEAVRDRWSQLAAIQPCDGALIGLRAEESRGRAASLRAQGSVARLASGLWRVCPLARWTWQDVAAYSITRDLPVLDAYVADGWEARTSARVPRDSYGIRDHAMASLKTRNLSAWNALVAEFPELQ